MQRPGSGEVGDIREMIVAIVHTYRGLTVREAVSYGLCGSLLNPHQHRTVRRAVLCPSGDERTGTEWLSDLPGDTQGQKG